MRLWNYTALNVNRVNITLKNDWFIWRKIDFLKEGKSIIILLFYLMMMRFSVPWILFSISYSHRRILNVGERKDEIIPRLSG